MSFPRYPLIFNPKAKSQKGKRALRFIMQHAVDFAMFATRSGEEARLLAKRFADEGEPIVVAAGGDGTLNAVVCGLEGSDTALGILPTGTMNVFAREMGIRCDKLEHAMEVIRSSRMVEVDLYRANEHPFIQMAGVGFDAQVIEETSWERKKALGPLAYLLSAVRVLGDQPCEMTAITDGGERYQGVCVMVGNGGLYGGQFRLFSKADNSDEMLDVLIFRKAGYLAVLDSLRGVAMGDVEKFTSSGVQYLQTKSLRVECQKEMPLQVDGDLVGRDSTFEFHPGQTRLKVVAPEEAVEPFFTSVLRGLAAIPRKLGGA